MKTLSELQGYWKLAVVRFFLLGGRTSLTVCFAISFVGTLWAIAASGNYAWGQVTSDNTCGNINITTQGIYGLEFRPQNTSLSDITASSQFGVNGVVTINTPGVDPTQGLAEFSVEPANVEVTQGCQAGREQASVAFFNTGKGGLAPNPYEPLGSELWEDESLPKQRVENPASASSASTAPATVPNKIVEAQGWLYDKKGQLSSLPRCLLPAPKVAVACVSCL